MHGNGRGPRLLEHGGEHRRLHEPLSQPLRILTVTGTSTAPQTASTMRAAFSGSFIRALPSPLFTIFGMGQPMLISIKSAPDASSASAAPPAITEGVIAEDLRTADADGRPVQQRPALFVLIDERA